MTHDPLYRAAQPSRKANQVSRRKYLTVRDIEEEQGVSYDTVIRWIESGLPCVQVRPKGGIRVPRDEYEQWLRDRTAEVRGAEK